MIPSSHVEAPAIPPAVRRRLRTLDPQLRVTWHKWSLDPITGRTIEATGKMNPETGERPRGPILDPAFYLWRKDEGSSHHFFVMSLPHFGHAEVAKLERDVARFWSPREIRDRIVSADERRRLKERETFRERQHDKIAANRSRIRDLVFDGKTGRRQARIVSAPGLSRATPGEVRPDAREDGWELPEG